MFVILLILSLSTALAAPPSPSISSLKITPELQAALSQKSTANIFVTMKTGTSEVLDRIRSTRFASRNGRLNSMHSLLVNHAAKSQKNLKAYLSSLKTVEFDSLWINNQLYVKEANANIVNHLASFEEVESIDEEFFAHLIEPVESKNVSKTDSEFEWGVVRIQAPDAWAELGNNDGRGVRVGVLDTGVLITHEALKDNFYGDHGWFDPSTKTELPTDRHGHGTHVTGTVAGSKGIGVAPGSSWMHCRGCQTISCSQYDLNRCGQFFACPTLADGTHFDCTKAPHIVSNSWGGGRGATWYQPVLDAWEVASIIPVFSIGNNGPKCGTTIGPGDHKKVIGVGSTTIIETISYFSSLGPSVDGRLKPEISAPGSDIISADHNADDGYRSNSGTSMAAPHVSGVIALLVARNPDLTLDEARTFLFENTDKELEFSGQVCVDIGDDVFPNHVFGHGRINALKSVIAQTKAMKH